MSNHHDGDRRNGDDKDGGGTVSHQAHFKLGVWVGLIGVLGVSIVIKLEAVANAWAACGPAVGSG